MGGGSGPEDWLPDDEEAEMLALSKDEFFAMWDDASGDDGDLPATGALPPTSPEFDEWQRTTGSKSLSPEDEAIVDQAVKRMGQDYLRKMVGGRGLTADDEEAILKLLNERRTAHEQQELHRGQEQVRDDADQAPT